MKRRFKMTPNGTDQPDLDARYRTLLILWFAIWMSVLLFLVLIYMSPVVAAENRNLTLALNSVGLVPVALSFLLKQRMLTKSVEMQRLDLVQSGYVLSLALFGLMNHFLTGTKYYYFAFIIAGLGLILHFPQKQNLVNASSYKQL